MKTPINYDLYNNNCDNSLDNESFYKQYISPESIQLNHDIEEICFRKDYIENFMDVGKYIENNDEIKDTPKIEQKSDKYIDKDNDDEFKPENFMKIIDKETQKESNDNEEKEENIFLNKKSKSSNNSNNSKISKASNAKKRRHTKFSDDNMRRKCKHMILDSLFNFINNKIYELYNGKIGKGIRIKQLQKLNQKQKSQSNIQFNKEFLQKPIREIFSDKLSGRITSFCPEHNKELIEMLLNESDVVRKTYFNNLFSLTFLQCLEHFRGSKNYFVLNGMNDMKMELQSYDDEEYAQSLEYYLNNYEKIINNKNPRKSKKENNIN
jgi:hypothetical protein